MLTLCQRDSRWASQKLGKSPFLVGRYGCLITCLSMITDFFGQYHDPKWMAKYLDFTADGMLDWASLPKRTCLTLHKSVSGLTADVDEAIKNPKRAAVLQVQGNHFVLAIKRIPLTKTYIIADPWYGDRRTTLRYKNQITGARIIELK